MRIDLTKAIILLTANPTAIAPPTAGNKED